MVVMAVTKWPLFMACTSRENLIRFWICCNPGCTDHFTSMYIPFWWNPTFSAFLRSEILVILTLGSIKNLKTDEVYISSLLFLLRHYNPKPQAGLGLHHSSLPISAVWALVFQLLRAQIFAKSSSILLIYFVLSFLSPCCHTFCNIPGEYPQIVVRFRLPTSFPNIPFDPTLLFWSCDT